MEVKVLWGPDDRNPGRTGNCGAARRRGKDAEAKLWPEAVFAPETWLAAIGWWEVLIGVTFLFHRTVRIAIALLALQMGGTFLPLVLLPGVTFQSFPLVPTMEGQFIIKNLIIISAALVIGGTVRERA